MADCLLGDFDPLTSYQLNEELWLAWQFDLPDSGKGMVQVFRRAARGYEATRFRLHGLEAKARYVVTDLDNVESARTVSGAEFEEKGLLVTATNQPGAVFITYQRLRW